MKKNLPLSTLLKREAIWRGPSEEKPGTQLNTPYGAEEPPSQNPKSDNKWLMFAAGTDSEDIEPVTICRLD